jgi:hypothetical protein
MDCKYFKADSAREHFVVGRFPVLTVGGQDKEGSARKFSEILPQFTSFVQKIREIRRFFRCLWLNSHEIFFKIFVDNLEKPALIYLYGCITGIQIEEGLYGYKPGTPQRHSPL